MEVSEKDSNCWAGLSGIGDVIGELGREAQAKGITNG